MFQFPASRPPCAARSPIRSRTLTSIRAWFDRHFPQIYHPRPMGQPRIAGILALALVASAAALISLRNGNNPAPPKSSEPRIASITPAGTDLLVGIGAADRIVAVSNYDDDREGIAGKPHIGDYQNIDWEKLSQSGANILILQYAADRLPPYISQRCADMGIRVVNLKIDTIDEICQAMIQLGDAIGEHSAGATAAANLRATL